MKMTILIIAEIIGLSLISAEFGLLLRNSGSTAHVFGYIGASIMIGTTLFWKFSGKKTIPDD